MTGSDSKSNGTTDRGHSIKIVAQRTGLSSHVIRVWERRYNAVQPRRTDTNRRLYSDADIERLRLLGEATEIGHAISNIADLSDDDLRAMIAADRSVPSPQPASKPGRDPHTYLEEAIQAAENLESDRLREVLERSSVDLPQIVVLEDIAAPLMYFIGEQWQKGEARVVHEHAAHAVVSAFVSSLKTTYAPAANAPTVLVTTPAGQLHELGALIVSAAAAADGWRTHYLGASLPAEEIVKAVEHYQCSALALSVVYPADDSALPDEFRKLKRLLPEDVEVIVGGRCAAGYSDVLAEIGATVVGSLRELRSELNKGRPGNT